MLQHLGSARTGVSTGGKSIPQAGQAADLIRSLPGLRYCIVLCLGLLQLLASPAALAQVQSCSPYKGQAFINELRIGSSGSSSTANQVEIVNSGNVAASVWASWQLVIYYQRSGRTASKKGGYYLSSGFTANGQFIFNNSKSIYLRNRASRFVDVALVDSAGRFIDYVALDSRIQTVPSCMGTPVVVDVTSSNDSNGDAARNPDAGSWPAAVSNTTRNTIGASNLCTSSGSDLVVDIQATPDNPIANVTSTSYSISVSNKSCSNSVANIALATSGINTSNFTGLNYSPSQGSSNQGVSNLNWTVGTLAAGASATLTVTGKPRVVGNLATTSTLSAPTSGLVNTGDDSDSKVIAVRDRNYVGFALDTATLTEGSDSSYSAVISSSLVASSAITVKYSVSGTATSIDTDLPLSGTVIIDPTDPESPTDTSIDFVIKDDRLVEPDKLIRLTILSVTSNDAQVLLDSTSAVMDITLQDDDDQRPDHLEIRHASGKGITCAPDVVTLLACADAACATPYVGGVSGSLSAGNLATLWPATAAFVIPFGSSSTTVALQLPVAGSSTLGVAVALPTPPNPALCNFGSPNCSYAAEDSGLLASVSAHVAETTQTLSLQAVKKADKSSACVSAFANLTRAVVMSCSYANPTTGAVPVRVGGKALNAANNAATVCDGTGQILSLAFNALGLATTTLQYADAGQVNLAMLYNGSAATKDLGLIMSGSASFIAAPASLAFSAITPGPIRAGSAFSATLGAVNSAGAVMPNFGRETGTPAITLGHIRAQPSGSGASNGVFIGGALGSFSGGKATAATLVWSEVGRIDLTASLSNYLGSGLGASGSTGSTGAVGRFIPHHFDVTATPACGTFSYAGQPFAVQVVARNGLASPGTTLNYDGSGATSPNFAQAGTLVDRALGGLGSFNGSGALPAGTFRAGVATLATPAYSFASKLSAPATAVLRATDADSVSSAGYAEPAMPLRSGRLRVFNTFGSEKTALGLPVQAQYWSGSAWLLNAIDSCTALPPAAVVAVQYLDHRGVATTAWPSGVGAVGVVNGQTRIDLAAPPGGRTGSIDFSLNLGSAAADQSCLASHPASTGAALPWLRAQNGACATGWASDPSARASFGIASPETRKSVHVREMY
jgi:MSHA biogenesis protein MshQ